MTDRLTLKLALPVKSGEIVGGKNTGFSVLISRLHTLPDTMDIFDAEIAMFELVLVSNTQNGDDSEEKGQVGECHQ